MYSDQNIEQEENAPKNLLHKARVICFELQSQRKEEIRHELKTQYNVRKNTNRMQMWEYATEMPEQMNL